MIADVEDADERKSRERGRVATTTERRRISSSILLFLVCICVCVCIKRRVSTVSTYLLSLEHVCVNEVHAYI